MFILLTDENVLYSLCSVRLSIQSSKGTYIIHRPNYIFYFILLKSMELLNKSFYQSNSQSSCGNTDTCYFTLVKAILEF